MWSMGVRWLSNKKYKMKKYQKPETEIVWLTTAETVMQVIVTSGGSGKVGGEDNPDDPDLANHNSIWDAWEEEEP